MSLAWSLRTLTREWFLAWTYRCAKVAYRSRLKLPCSLTNSHQRLETGGTLHNLHSVRDNDGFAGNIIFPSLVARRYSTYGLHRFLLFFFSFSLSYRTFMPHSFHCPLFFQMFLWLFTYFSFHFSIFMVYINDLNNCVFRQILLGEEDEMSRTCSRYGREGKQFFSWKGSRK